MGEDPKFCPCCGGVNIMKFMVDWEATSEEEPNNKATISEHQCADCEMQSFGPKQET